MNELRHLAIIMDGNSRWAVNNNLTKLEGHKAGAEKGWNIVDKVMKRGVKNLTLFAFSAENWSRPLSEVNNLLNLLDFYLDREMNKIFDAGINLKFIGNIDKLSLKLQEKIQFISDNSSKGTNLNLYIAFSYGSKEEIVNAAKKAILSGINPEQLTVEKLCSFFYAPNMPDVDLLIRTGSVKRLSNFLLWQSAYAELFFSDKLWPDFNEEELDKAISEFKMSKRNFGGR